MKLLVPYTTYLQQTHEKNGEVSLKDILPGNETMSNIIPYTGIVPINS